MGLTLEFKGGTYTHEALPRLAQGLPSLPWCCTEAVVAAVSFPHSVSRMWPRCPGSLVQGHRFSTFSSSVATDLRAIKDVHNLELLRTSRLGGVSAAIALQCSWTRTCVYPESWQFTYRAGRRLWLLRGSWDPGRNCFTLVCPVSRLDMASPHQATRCRTLCAFVSVLQIWQGSVDPVNACLSPSFDVLEVVVDT